MENDNLKNQRNNTNTLLSAVFDELFDSIDSYAYCAGSNATQGLKFLKLAERKEIAKNKLDELLSKNCRLSRIIKKTETKI
jgi:hypothetical protein